jgi:chemotaxis-related protein WspD
VNADEQVARLTEGCWRTIGVGGDASCPELKAVTHCRNCPVFTQAGRQLIERPPPAGYVEEWTSFLAQAKTRGAPRSLAVLIFRLGDEWLALDATDVVEIAETRPVHRIAHRPGPVLGGLVNIRGALQLFVSVRDLLRIERSTAAGDGRALERFVVIHRGEDTWVFRADEVMGIHRFAVGDLGPAPVTVAHGMASLSRGILPLGERRVGYLDGEALFARLKRAVG